MQAHPSADGSSPPQISYTALQPNEIRLLSIQPGSFDDPIHCSITHHSLNINKNYEALSYVCTIRLPISSRPPIPSPREPRSRTTTHPRRREPSPALGRCRVYHPQRQRGRAAITADATYLFASSEGSNMAWPSARRGSLERGRCGV